jgi:hypothetical protein
MWSGERPISSTAAPQVECREITRSLLSTSATAQVAQRLADKAISISRRPAQVLRHLPLRVQQLHSRQRLHLRPQQLPRLQRQPRLPRLRRLLLQLLTPLHQLQQLLTRPHRRQRLPSRLWQQLQLPQQLLQAPPRQPRLRLLQPRRQQRQLPQHPLRRRGLLRHQGLARHLDLALLLCLGHSLAPGHVVERVVTVVYPTAFAALISAPSAANSHRLRRSRSTFGNSRVANIFSESSGFWREHVRKTRLTSARFTSIRGFNYNVKDNA